ncbi:2-dehydropantoate 2-reductase [Parapedobacter composti]|uniref:2-dehydropantoate 2-reductase n=2 Tax=Parapedobacter composti TaxID=623281 RepID=A0A1I1KD40_9SPHI|nr:2-dehydropantoate 2-reductase [Parapedobacter composti]
MYASKLHALDDSLVKVVVDEERKRRYEQKAILVNEQPYRFQYLTPSSEAPVADLVIIAVKEYQLADALPLLKPFVGQHTCFLSLLNGISSEKTIGEAYGIERVLYAFGIAMDAQRTGRDVSYTDMGHMVFGEADNAVSPRVKAIKALFEAAAIPYQVPPDIHQAMWFKFMVNVAVNQVSALLRIPFGVFAKYQEARALLIQAAQEVQEVAQRKGIDLTETAIGKMVDTILSLNPDGKTSMLQDVEAQRPTELETFAGEVIRQGEALTVATPINRFLYNALALVEKGYSG